MSTEQQINTIQTSQINDEKQNTVSNHTLDKPTDVNDEKQQLPKMYYKIIHKNAKVVFNEIKERTNNFQINNQEYKQWLIQQLKDRNVDYVYGFLNDSPSIDTNKKVIGKDGCYLMMTTQNTNSLFIWHNRASHQFEFWALQPTSLIQAINLIRARLHKGTNGSPETPQQ